MTHNVFLSHNSSDKPAVERLAEKLEAAGFTPWLDKWNLVPGDPWQPALEAALKDSDVCAVFLGPDLLGPWQNEEMQVAINRRVTDKQFRVIPVLLPKTERGKRGDVPAFLANVTWVEFHHSIDDEHAFKCLVNSIRGLPTRPDKKATIAGACPYKGLQTFNITDAPYFFGRDALTDWLVADVRRMIQSDRGPRFLAIVGASGSGKSSIARAGLLYELEQGAIEGSDQWARIIIDHPGADPITELATQGSKVLGLPQQAIALDRDFIQPIRQNPEHRNKLHLQAALALADQPGKRLLIFIDQFEEIFTACTDVEWRKRFVELLLHAARVASGKVMIVITIRLDFLDKCVDHPELAGIISGGMELVGAMNDNELEAAIVSPAALAGVEISPSLVQTLIQAVRKQPGSLPLLEHVLKKLWEKKSGNTITDADYTTGVKGIEGALADHADEILNTKCGSEEQQKKVLDLMTRLVHISDTAAPETDTRVRYPITEDDYLLLKPFVDAHLLITSSKDSIIDNKSRSTDTSRIIEVAHEALIRHWPKLQEALKDRHFVMWQERLGTAMTEWQRCNDAESLLEGQRLVDAKRWLKLKKDELNKQELMFIQRSIAHLRWATLRTLSLILVPLAIVVVFFIWSNSNQLSPKTVWYVVLAKIGIYTLQPEMVAIPTDKDCQKQPCKFLMGSTKSDPLANENEQPPHRVSFNKSFKISKHEVTFDEYQVFAFLISSDGGCVDKHELGPINDYGWGKDNRPVISVSWEDARCYAQWLSKKTKKNYHLPSEAQWEYAVRASANPPSVYYWGQGAAKYYAWFGDNSEDKTHPVGEKWPNVFGLHDMSGNVLEWVQDCFHDNYIEAPDDGSAWEKQNGGNCKSRVLRGGSWGNDYLRSATRFKDYPGLRNGTIGFRLAQD